MLSFKASLLSDLVGFAVDGVGTEVGMAFEELFCGECALPLCDGRELDAVAPFGVEATAGFG